MMTRPSWHSSTNIPRPSTTRVRNQAGISAHCSQRRALARLPREIGVDLLPRVWITVADLIEAELLKPGDRLLWDRPKLGSSYGATVTDNAAIELDNGGTFATPSRAAKQAAHIPACDGWYAWKVERPGGLILLHDLRKKLVAKVERDSS